MAACQQQAAYQQHIWHKTIPFNQDVGGSSRHASVAGSCLAQLKIDSDSVENIIM